MPFKQYMILAYKALPYHGFVDWNNTLHPYEFTVKVKSWWGWREKTVKMNVSIVFGTDVERLFRTKTGQWLTKLPWK